MAKFIYRMQNVLDVKLKMEDQARSSFAAAMARLNEEEEALGALTDRRKWYETEGRRMREDSINVTDLRDNTRALENLDEQIKLKKQDVAIAQDNVDRARGRLQVAMQERKTQEILKDNAFEEFKRELNAAESKEVDELVSYRYGQKSSV